MKLKVFDSPSAFLETNLEMLMENEALSNLPIGIAQKLKEKESYGAHTPFLASVIREGQLIMSALMTPPFPLNLYSRNTFNHEAATLIVDYLLANEISVSGVIGLKQTTEAFSEIWKARTEEKWEIAIQMRIYQLDRVKEFSRAEGKLILANETHVDLICDWLDAFEVAVGSEKKQATAKIAS